MRLDEEKQITETLQSPLLDRLVTAHLEQISDEGKTTHTPLPSHSPSRDDYFAIVGRATNDAVRDWNVKSARLSGPQGLESLPGYDASSAESNEIGFWQSNLHPGDRARVGLSIRDALASSSDYWSGEYRFRRIDGTFINVLERAVIFRDNDGAAERLIGSLMDVTARKQLQDQLCRSQKMEAFGQLAGGVAHDFNNFLTTILGYGDLLLSERQIKGQLADHVSEIRAAAGRASALTQQLLALSRRQAHEPVVVEVNSIISNLERSLLRLIGENISVVCHFHGEKEGAHIKADRSQITQIILNLAVNARDAMPKGGQLTLETAIVDLGKSPDGQVDSNEFPPGQYVVITLADTGTGMSEEAKAHLFEPFFTTKIDEKRSGLGLATCYGIVRQNGGRLRVES